MGHNSLIDHCLTCASGLVQVLRIQTKAMLVCLLVAHLPACINDLSIANAHEVVVALTRLKIVLLTPMVLLLFKDLPPL